MISYKMKGVSFSLHKKTIERSIMIHRITGTHLFVSTFGAGLWVDVESEAEVQRDGILAKVEEAISRLGLLGCMKLSYKRIYNQWVFMLETPVDLLYTACNILEWSAGLLTDFDAIAAEHREEENLSWREVRAWAVKNDVPCVDDEDGLTLGMGKTAETWTKE